MELPLTQRIPDPNELITHYIPSSNKLAYYNNKIRLLNILMYLQ